MSNYPFPPFPLPPVGVIVVSFEDFKEHGILRTRDEQGQEVDGAGIPTIALPMPDDSDPADAEDDLPGGNSQQYSRPQYQRKQWWQWWDEGDQARSVLSFNDNLPQMDRLFMAASSFRNTRFWPSDKYNKIGPKYFWDQFRIYMGTLGFTPAWNRTDKPAPEEVEPISPDYSDTEDDKTANINIGINMNYGPGSKKPTRVYPPYAYDNVKPVDLDSDEAVKALLELDKLHREEMAIDFLEDPEKVVQTYLSSYMRDQGFMWSDRNLETVPRLVVSFLRFIIKNRIFPEPMMEKKIRNALLTSEKALRELPLTSVISKILPDEFSKRCNEYWGPKKPVFSFDDEDGPDDQFGNYDVQEEFEEPSQVKIIEVNSDDEEVPTGTEAENNLDKFPTAENVVPIQAQAEVEWDNIPTASNVIPVQTEAEDGKTPIQSPPELITINTVCDAFRDIISPTTLFPLSHTSGIVEQSVRRIKDVLGPSTVVSSYAKLHKKSVDRELENMLVKIVLVPWPGSGLYGHEQARIINDDGAETDHDVLEDEITLLATMSSKNLDLLKGVIGMGLAGTWVQLKPLDEKELDSRRLTYWYVDDLDAVLPSYWIP